MTMVVKIKKPYNIVRRVAVTKVLADFPWNGTKLDLAHRLMKKCNLNWPEAKQVIDWYATV